MYFESQTVPGGMRKLFIQTVGREYIASRAVHLLPERPQRVHLDMHLQLAAPGRLQQAVDVEPPPTRNGERQPARVLLVDDDEQVRSALVALLESTGHSVTAAATCTASL